MTWYDYHLLAAHDARLETVLAEMQRLRRYGVTDWERTAGAAGWNEVVRYAREVRDALGVDDIML